MIFDEYNSDLGDGFIELIKGYKPKAIYPCDNCGEFDDHECWIDGVMYGPWEEE